MSFPGDGIEFDPDSARAEPIRDDTNYGGYRVRLEARLDTANITLQIDVGFGDAIVPPPRYFAFEGETLTLAIDATFKRRTTDISLEHPAFMSKGFFIDLGRTTQWRAYLDRGNLSGAPADFGVIGDALRVFLGPPFEALARKSEFRANWPRGGPWA